MKHLLCFVVVVLCGLNLTAQPSNDNCANAIALPLQAGACAYGTYTNVGATASGMSASCVSTLWEDIYFSVVADNTEFTIELDNIPSSGRVVVYDTCNGAEMYCGILSIWTLSHQVIGLTPGHTYYIRISSDPNAPDGTIDICVWSPVCTVSADAVVDQHETCQSDCDGGASVSASGGALPYSYLWSNGATTSTITNVCPATYTVTVTDDDDCTATDEITILAGGGPTASINLLNDPTCPNSCDGMAQASGGTFYSWSNGETSALASNLCDGTNTVTVTDSNGCTDTAQVDINAPSNNPINSFNDSGSGLWNDSSNWSQGIIPLECHEVIIPSGEEVLIMNGENAICLTIEVQIGSIFIVEQGAILEVIAD